MEPATSKKTRTSALVACSLLLIPSLFAAPALPVAEGYPVWTGISPKNHIRGRVLLSDAELRQRITVVVEFDAAKTLEHVDMLGSLGDLNGIRSAVGHGGTNWESVQQLPRDVMVIFVARNAKTHEQVNEALRLKGEDVRKHPNVTVFTSGYVPVYENVTFEGAPDNGGKLPFVYVMGVEGKEPAYKAAANNGTCAAVRQAVSAQRKKIADDGLVWRPFFGYVAEPKHNKKAIESALAKGTSLDPVEAKLLKGVTSKDPEAAKEAQMLYDGLCQTRSDLAWMVQLSYGACPHVAAYKLGFLVKCWPKTKKQLADVSAKLKANDAAQPLIKMYPKIAQWADPNFTCKNAAEAKKIGAELQKMKKALEPLKEDKNIQVQNGALLLDGTLDELIATMPAKVSQK